MTKTTKHSAGLLIFRKSSEIVEVFLVHPGGPYFLKKDEGSWTIPKGKYSMKEIRVLVERWRVHYNTVRPHSSLRYRPPAPQAWAASSLGRGEAG